MFLPHHKKYLLFQWCRGGRCISKTISIDLTYNNSKSPLAKIEKIDGGWTEWKYSKDCASACLSGEEGRLRSGSTGIMIGTRICNNPRYIRNHLMEYLQISVHYIFKQRFSPKVHTQKCVWCQRRNFKINMFASS